MTRATWASAALARSTSPCTSWRTRGCSASERKCV
ncbi:Uncharacterised protein [Bordetella pertussis]|nr:Uncharacterised protein [Bordetella pertussis]